jgi:hypothetical protein
LIFLDASVLLAAEDLDDPNVAPRIFITHRALSAQAVRDLCRELARLASSHRSGVL